MDRVAYGGPWRSLCEELGDLLFQIVFHAQLATEKGEFTMADVCRAVSDKLESRHPHVFGERQVRDSAEVLFNWAQIKAEEKKRKTGRVGSVLDGVPTAAPALARAERLTEKASRMGFDWPDVAGVRAKLDEELAELDEAIASKDRDALEHELGDVLFSLANLGRFLRTPPEDALRMAIRRFTTRFQHIESALQAEGVPLGGATLEHMERHWQTAKAAEKALPPPASLPRAPLTALRFSVRDVAAQRAFWDAVAPLIGWHVVQAPPGEARYGDGALLLVFSPAEGPDGANPEGPRGELTLGAPSSRSVERLRGLLEASHPGAVQGGKPTGVRFQDPAGLVWEYTA
ncbi:MazG protein [Stigmatella aurantiaca DW4/3-1]|nr:MazG protein [Stigmatella aurantiaca DW4/3-1]